MSLFIVKNLSTLLKINFPFLIRGNNEVRGQDKVIITLSTNKKLNNMQTIEK